MTMNAKKDKNEEKVNAIANNPCGICKAMGLPICRGHGGGGGGGGGGSGDESGTKTLSAKPEEPNKKEPSVLDTLLLSDIWSPVEDEDLAFKFENVYTPLSITLRMDTGCLLFKSKEELTEKEQKAVEALFDAVVAELKLFKQELSKEEAASIKVSRVGDTLTITIPSPKLFDMFVRRLMDKNMLPRHSEPLQQQKIHNPEPIVADELPPESQGSAVPNPFDINGPKPPRWTE